MSILRLEGVTREVGDFVILDRIDAAIGAGDRIGLVGPNGAGKTTMLRLIYGPDEPDAGEIHRKRHLQMGMLSQEAHVDAPFISSPTLRQAVRRGAARLEELEKTLRRLEHDGRVEEPEYEHAQHEFDVRDGYSLDQRVEAALSGLGFERDQWDRPPTNLSGGEQTRAALARLLLSDPELLLLDEPTNHLDLGAMEWLEEHLSRRHGSLLVASHDRAFLDATVNRVWELRDRKLTPFRGNYSAYFRQRAERDVLAAKEAEDRAGQIERELELIQQYRHQRKHGKMHEHEARLEALQPLEKRRNDARLHLPTEALVGGGAARSYESVVRVENLVVGYGKSVRRAERANASAAGADSAVGSGGGLAPAATSATATSATATSAAVADSDLAVAKVPWLELRRGDRVGIVGPNGAGKTTLLRTIAGELPPLDGSLDLGRNVQLSYLAQLREQPIPGTSILDAILDEVPLTQGAARSHLARFLFRGDDVFKDIDKLSGGERSRLELALLFLLPSNLLLLDEPTNHLDIPAREALESFLTTTPSTLLIVSHDRRLLEIVCDKLWVVDEGLAAPFDGGYKAWRQAISDGWTVKSAVEQEASRLHGGRRSPSNGRKTAGAVSEGTSGARAKVGSPSTMSSAAAASSNGAGAPPRPPAEKLSKDAYRRRKAQVEQELTRLSHRKAELEAALLDPTVHGNFVELRRVSGELATVNDALTGTEEAWLLIEEAAP